MKDFKMKRMLFLSVFIVMNTFLVSVIKTQSPPCYPEGQGIYYEIPLNQNTPPYSTDMPLDVLIGYVAMDSLTKNVDIEDFNEFMMHQQYNDTLRTMMRYLYQMIEYNPEKYLNYIHNGHPNKFSPGDYDQLFYQFLIMDSPQPILEASLLASFTIAKITIIDIHNYIDTTAKWAKTNCTVTAKLDSIFKGHSMLNCSNPPPIEEPINQKCIKFEIAKEWFQDTTLYNSILPGESFFVFFENRFVCTTETSSYFTIFPLRFVGSLNNSIYPIINNELIDTNNELGFGTNVELSIFYNGIQNKINEIKNFTL